MDTETLTTTKQHDYHPTPTATTQSPITYPSLETDENRLGPLLGKSPCMQQLFKSIRLAARSDIPILLLGETGTGKDLIAKTIHHMSRRGSDPYIATNLGALPSELVSSELFGHERGSFSGAHRRHLGVFERAGQGTVFLDEIDCIAEKSRVSLLRLLDSNEFRRLGGREDIKSSARLITASNADLPDLVEQDRFRKDLFYRLDVFRIDVPPLRDRPDDMPLLTEHLIDRFNAELDKQVESVQSELMDIVRAYDWPGNVRELKNVIQRAMIVCTGIELRVEDLPPRLQQVPPQPRTITVEVGTSLQEVERLMVLRALSETNNNRKEAAALLGISRRAIYNKFQRHGIGHSE